MKMTEEELAQEIASGRRGSAGGRLLEILGGVLVVAGMILGGSLPLLIVGAVMAGLGGVDREKDKGCRRTAGL